MTNIIEKPKTNTLIEEYRQQALAYGHEKAIRTFATPMLQAWEKACEGYADEDTELEGFADLMSEVFNVRDAAIAAAINPRFKIGTIINLAAKAHTPYYKRLLFKTLVDGFTNPDIKPDHDRLHNAITAACGLTDLASEKKYRAHPLAVAAYLSWWDGRWRMHIPTRFSLSMRTGPRVSLHSFWSRCRRAKSPPTSTSPHHRSRGLPARQPPHGQNGTNPPSTKNPNIRRNNMGLFIDIHAIQTLPPANLNRDENGRPKTAIYGGVPRMRVSSQAWKKAIRDNFRDTLDTGRLGSRSREFTKMIAQRLDRDPEDERLLKATGELMKTAGLPSDKNRPGSTSALQFFGEQQWQKLAQYAEEAYGSTDPKKSIASHRTDIKKLLDSDQSIDIAFFGRMSASSDKGTGSEYVVDAASQFAHAISVNRADVENDYYAAVDDCDNTSGAGMIGETGYLSATLYRYACVDVNLLNRNLGYDKEAVRLALSTFLNAFALSLPSGKQNSFGHQTLPSFIETVIRIDRPINLVEAYEKPVTTDTIPTSVQRLLEQQADYQNTYGLAAADTFTMADLNARKAMGKEQQETLLTLPQLVTETTSTVIKAL